jgi:hypothetical protein
VYALSADLIIDICILKIYSIIIGDSPMTSRTKKTKGPLTFDEYKTIKDEIIEISEQRFENIITRRLKEFKKSLMEELNVKFDAINERFNAIYSKFDAVDSKFDVIDSRFDAIDSRFDAIDSKFSSLEKRMTFLTWFLPLFMTILMFIMKYLDK